MQAESLTRDDLVFLMALEQQLTEEAVDHRQYPRYPIRLGVLIAPADTSRSDECAVPGHTVDLSQGGLRAELQTPLQVGDHYRVRLFVAGERPLELFARCLRCGLLEERRFEAALRFFAPLAEGDLPGAPTD